MINSKDRIPLPPIDAKRTNMTCHFCIVGCGYHVYKWPENIEGGRSSDQNALRLDFRSQLTPLAVTMTPAMHNVISDKDGQRYNIMILPDKGCVVNQGLASVRGGQMASAMYGDSGPAKERLKNPRIFMGDKWLDTSWDQALALYAGVTRRILDTDGPDEIFFNASDHGGAGGGFEFTWATGKLMFTALKTQMVRIHNRPAYNSECHATRDMGISELNNSYEDAEVADVIWSIGNNPYETQTNYFLAHWVPNLQGATVAKKEQWFKGETVTKGRIIFVDPRRTPSVAIAETVAGKENVLHLDIQPGTDIALFNGLLSYVVSQGWHDEEFIARYTTGFEEAIRANQLSLEECSKITGIPVAKIKLAAEWSYKPKASGARARVMHAYEKGIIWGNDNYLIQSALVDLVLATRNVGRRGTGVVRMGGHQEGYARPPYPGKGKIYLDEQLINGKGKMYTIWGANPFQTTLNAEQHRKVVLHRAGIVREALAQAKVTSMPEMIDAVYEAVSKQGGLFLATVNLYPTMLANAAHLMLPGAQPGECNLTAMNGERRIRLSERFMDPPGSAKPDALIAADIANTLKHLYETDGNAEMAARFGGFDWKSEEDAFNDGFRNPAGIDSQGGGTGNLVTYERLRAQGTNGVQLPVKEYKDGKLIGTEMMYTDNKFSTKDGKAHFLPSKWPGLPEPVAVQKHKHRFWINNGRVNEAWQTMYHDQYLQIASVRYPMAILEMNPADAQSLSVNSGDIVEVFNDYGSTYALGYVEPAIKTGQTFLQFAHYNGVAGDVVTAWTDRNVIPYYKGTWASVRRVGVLDERTRETSFKSRRYNI
jgi:arsenite oxidase large subunit